MEPGVRRHRALESVQPLQRLRQQPKRRRQQLALVAAPRRVLAWGDQELVGEAASVGCQGNNAIPLEHTPLARGELRLHMTADGALTAVLLGTHCRWRLGEPDQLRVTVRQARTGFPSFVQERMDVGIAGLLRRDGPLAPGGGDAPGLVFAQLRERTDVARRRDHDLVMFEDRVEVRHYPNRPARRIGCTAAWTDSEGLRRRPVLPALAEGAGGELLLGWQDEVGPRICARSMRPAGRDHDPLAGDRVLAKLSAGGQLEAPPPFFFSRKGLIRSIGAGKTIVVVGEPLMSSSVCR